jgi:hypothetical protein
MLLQQGKAKKSPIIVVGGGLFGAIAAALARAEDYAVTVIDGCHQYAASKAAGCVLAPSWLSSLSSEQIAVAMRVLHRLYTVHDITFSTNLIKDFHAQRIDPGEILRPPDILTNVHKVGNGWVQLEDGVVLYGAVLVAAGIGCADLLDMPKIDGLWGASATFFGYTMTTPRLHLYAPYKQAIAFNLAPGKIWMGDGTALIESTWMKERSARLEATIERGTKLLSLKSRSPVEINEGARPYVEGYKAGFFQQVAPRTWVSTGGAKNGTVLAAYQAQQFIDALT